MKRIILIVGVCLSLNLFAQDSYVLYSGAYTETIEILDNSIFDETFTLSTEDLGLDAFESPYWIEYHGDIDVDGIGIDTEGMSGDLTIIVNAEVISDTFGIYAKDMSGSIISVGDIWGDINGINAVGMIGSIYNRLGGDIQGLAIGIDAEAMIGAIYNSGLVGGEVAGIDANSMVGDIYNYNEIAGDVTGIIASSMEGDIHNSVEIVGGFGDSGYGINSFKMVGNIYNYAGALIKSEASDANVGLYAEEMIGNIINEGIIVGYLAAINSSSMAGNITNSGTILSENDAIYAESMIGDITNNTLILSDEGTGIVSSHMIGNINNNAGALITSGQYGINASEMIGDIVNSGEIFGEYRGISSTGMLGNIINNGTIKSNDNSNSGIGSQWMIGNIYNNVGAQIQGQLNGIGATGMLGNIYNDGTIEDNGVGNGIESTLMAGDIINTGTITGTLSGIIAEYMEGDIMNNQLGSIHGSEWAILANYMVGNIINYGSINSDNGDIGAISANFMSGSIINYDTIYSENGLAIYTYGMTGDIVNHSDATIESNDSIAIYLAEHAGTLYNYGYITSGIGKAIVSDGDLNLVASGDGIVGDIAADGIGGGTAAVGTEGDITVDGIDNTLSITNDMDTILDLSQAPLIDWYNIDLLQGEMIITDIETSEYSYVSQIGDNTYIHLSIQSSDVEYSIYDGTLNPYDESSPFGYVFVDGFYAYDDSTIEIDFGDDSDIDFIQAIEGEIYSDVTIKFIPQYVFELGWSDIYQTFENIIVSGAALEAPLFYTVTEAIISDAIANDYYVVISRNDETYSDYAHYYNENVAKYIDTNRNYEDMPEEAEDLLLELEQALTADELNALLEPYNMVGYASLANNNIHWINNRTRNLFNVLGNNIGSETSVSNGSIGSSYATANTNLNRDFNGNNIWFNVYMSDNTLDGEAGFEQESDGYEVAFGIDKEINASMILGLSLNISDFESDITGGLPVNVESDGFGLSAYGQYSQEAINHKFAIGYTGYKNEATRAGAEADFDSNEFYAAYRIEYTIEKKSCSIVPLAGMQYAHITYEDIIEDGDVTGLKGYDYDSLQSELGVKVLKQFENLQLNAGASWLHELMDTESDATAVSGIGSFSQDAIERDEDTFRLSLGLDYQINDRINFSLDYAKEIGDNTDSDSINAKVSFSF